MGHDPWDQIKEEIILLCVQWYLTERLSYSQLKIVMQQRGFKLDPRTINNLVTEYSPLAMKRFKETERRRKKGWRVIQIPFKMQGRKKYLYRALDAQGNTLDFIITGRRSKEQAKNFFEKTISKNSQINTTKILSKREKASIQNNNLLSKFFIIVILSSLGIFVFNQVAKYTENNNHQFQNNSSANFNSYF
ncbi:DDE-type integrase/transposase/recombinase [Geminocystis sp. NIES-3709]|uniref:DDE-type integrase/transposase/recombinase n=1 Tax=Geminocystis sp. NIES-3709 TaxID=1617448 RepID=UPI0005FC96DC|nr:DDE-type integrase/transposase/recombinase [Geminocystis sp. NIES-3709]BAQ64920.1 mobile element protein [Geminocystis sp. NIES-3709]